MLKLCVCVCVVVSTSVLFMTVYTSCTRTAVGKEVRDDYVLMSGDIFFSVSSIQENPSQRNSRIGHVLCCTTARLSVL